MSYCRFPFYIYSNGKELVLDGNAVDEDLVNVFIYKLATFRKEELEKRIQSGKAIFESFGKEELEERIQISKALAENIIEK